MGAANLKPKNPRLAGPGEVFIQRSYPNDGDPMRKVGPPMTVRASTHHFEPEPGQWCCLAHGAVFTDDGALLLHIRLRHIKQCVLAWWCFKHMSVEVTEWNPMEDL